MKGKNKKSRSYSDHYHDIMTNESLIEKLKKIIVVIHPYEIPEILGFNVSGGNDFYLKWHDEETR